MGGVQQQLVEFLANNIYYHAFSLLVVLLIVASLIINHYGRSKNLQIVKKYQLMMRKSLHQWFDKYDQNLVQESANVIKVYASGRESCLFAIMAFAMVPRQQLLSFCFNWLFFNQKDQFVVQIPIVNQSPLPITLAVIRKKQIRTITKKAYPDIKHLCKQYRPIDKATDNVPETHSILVQKSEHVKLILSSEKDVNFWKQSAKSVKILYLSNCNKYSRYPMAVRMVVTVGQDLMPMLQYLIGFVDRMSKIKMTVGERKQAAKRRDGLNISYE